MTRIFDCVLTIKVGPRSVEVPVRVHYGWVGGAPIITEVGRLLTSREGEDVYEVWPFQTLPEEIAILLERQAADHARETVTVPEEMD